MTTLQRCMHCFLPKTRIKKGVRHGRNTYMNERGKEWSSRVCPECKLLKQRARQKKERDENKALNLVPVREGVPGHRDIYVAPGTPIRKCRKCGNDTVNYRVCAPCHSSRTLSTEYEDMVYGG